MTAEQVPDSEPRATHGDGSDFDPSGWLDQHGDALYRYARARVGSREQAEDLVQETLLTALRARDHFEARSSARTWLVAILRRKIVDAYRRVATSIREELPSPGPFFDGRGLWIDPPSPWKGPAELAASGEFWSVLNGCLGDLPRPLAEAFVLRELEQYEVESLCDILGLTPGNLRVRLHRARLLLRECLERRGLGLNPDPSPSTRTP